MAKKRPTAADMLTAEELFRLYKQLSGHEQSNFLESCEDDFANAVGLRIDELEEELERFVHKGEKRKPARDAYIASLRDKHFLQPQQIYDDHQAKLTSLNGGKKVSIAVISKVYYRKPQK